MRGVISAGLLACVAGLCGVMGCGNDAPQPVPEITIGGGTDSPNPDPEEPAAEVMPATDGAETTENAVEAIGATITRAPDGTIRSISCYRNKRLTDRHLGHIAENDQLTALDLRATGLTDIGLKHVSGLQGLEQLYLGGTQVTADGLASLKDLTNLKVLNLQNLPVDAQSYTSHLGGLTKISRLNLAGTRFDDQGLQALAEMKNLQAIVLPRTVTDTGLAHLAGHIRLETLVLDKTGVTDEGLSELSPLAALKQLSLRNTSVTLEGICRLSAPRTGLNIAFDQGTLTDGELVLFRNNGNDDLAAVAELNQLKVLKLDDTSVSDPGLAHLSKMFNLQQLVHLKRDMITTNLLDGRQGLKPLAVKKGDLASWLGSHHAAQVMCFRSVQFDQPGGKGLAKEIPCGHAENPGDSVS